MRLASLVIAASLSVAAPAGAATMGFTDLASYLLAGGNATIHLTFNPKIVTTTENGASFSPDVVFRSPEYLPDQTLVYHVGSPGDGDGCIGGLLLGSITFNGSLELDFAAAQASVAADIRSAGRAVTVDVYSAGGVLLLTFDTLEPPTFFGVISDVPVDRIVLTTGGSAMDDRDATCFDNLRYGDLVTPTLPRTWGHVKAIHR